VNAGTRRVLDPASSDSRGRWRRIPVLLVAGALLLAVFLIPAGTVLADDPPGVSPAPTTTEQTTPAPPSDTVTSTAPPAAVVGTPALSPAPGLTRHDSTDAALACSGTWSTYTKAAAWNGSYRRSSTAGASVTITFDGTQLDWIAMMGTTTGIADVYLDGDKKATIDLASAVAIYQENVWSTGSLASGVHTVRIVRSSGSASGKYLTIDAVDVAGSLLKVQRVEQSSSLVAWSGSWSSRSSSSYSGGSDKYSNAAGRAVEVDFTGTKIVWIGRKASTYGLARVTLDGTKAFDVDCYNATGVYQQVVWDSGILANTAHTLKIECLGTKDSASGGTYVSVDAFDLVGTATQAYLWNRYEETEPKILYSGTWSSASASGASGGSQKTASTSAASLSITFTGDQLDWIATKGPDMGTADVAVDGKDATPVVLTNGTTIYQQKVWSTGKLSPGTHRVEISWDENNSSGAVIDLDAFDIRGSLPASSTLTTAEIKWVEQRLTDLSYRPGTVDGVSDAKTKGAIIAFQKWEGLSRNGTIDSATWNRLQTARRPTPSKSGSSNPWIEVNKAKQVLLYCKDGAVVWTLPVCTGSASVGIVTPSGTFTVLRKTKETSPRYLPLYILPSPSVLAIHGYPNVPTSPASHGCIRTQIWDQDDFYPLIGVGTYVYIY
jgi:hypothetical protein